MSNSVLKLALGTIPAMSGAARHSRTINNPGFRSSMSNQFAKPMASTGLAVLGLATYGGMLSSNGNPSTSSMLQGGGAATVAGLAMGFGAPAMVSGLARRRGLNNISKSVRLPARKGMTSLYTAPALGKIQAHHTPRGGRWNPEMVDSMQKAFIFGDRMNSAGGRQMLFASGAMLSGNLFNSSVNTGNTRNHSVNRSRSGNHMR